MKDSPFYTSSLNSFILIDITQLAVRHFTLSIIVFLLFYSLYCYAQKHVKSIKAVTRPGEIAEKQRYKSIRRPKMPQKKFKVRSNPHNSSPYHVSDHKAAITVGVIMGVFLICWVPFFCVNIVAAFCKTCIAGQTFKVLSWLGYSNSAFNPIIYSIFNKEFRDAFKRLLTTRNPCCKQDVANVNSRNSERYVTDYATSKHVVSMVNSARSSADIEQISAIWPRGCQCKNLQTAAAVTTAPLTQKAANIDAVADLTATKTAEPTTVTVTITASKSLLMEPHSNLEETAKKTENQSGKAVAEESGDDTLHFTTASNSSSNNMSVTTRAPWTDVTNSDQF